MKKIKEIEQRFLEGRDAYGVFLDNAGDSLVCLETMKQKKRETNCQNSFWKILQKYKNKSRLYSVVWLVICWFFTY